MPYSLKWNSETCYKTSQCLDENDCENALKLLEIYNNDCLKRYLKPPRGFYERKNSIQNKLKKKLPLPPSVEQAASNIVTTEK